MLGYLQNEILPICQSGLKSLQIIGKIAPNMIIGTDQKLSTTTALKLFCLPVCSTLSVRLLIKMFKHKKSIEIFCEREHKSLGPFFEAFSAKCKKWQTFALKKQNDF